MREVPEKPEMSEKIVQIGISHIFPNPAQPRAHFDEQGIRELASSIAQHGILQPLTVRQTGSRYELVAGERRLRAAQMLRMAAVPCVIVRVSDRESALLALIENLQRRDLDFFEVALGYRRLMDTYGLTQAEAASRVGKSQSAVANKLRLLRFDTETMERIRAHRLTERHARALLRLDPEDVGKALDEMIARGMTVAQAEQYVEKLLVQEVEKKKSAAPRIVLRDSRIFLNTVNRALKVMKDAGVPAQCKQATEGDWVVLTIRVPRIHSTGITSNEI